MQVSVESTAIQVPEQCWGRSSEERRIILSNDGSETILYKVKVTNKARFTVKPGFGLVGSKNKAEVVCKPRPFDDADNYEKERLTFVVGIPEGQVSLTANPKFIWKGDQQPNKTMRLVVSIKYLKKPKNKQKKRKAKEEDYEFEEEEENAEMSSLDNSTVPLDSSVGVSFD